MYMGNELLSPHSQPPLSVGGILKVAYSTNSCIAVNEYVILILKIKFYNRIRKRFPIMIKIGERIKELRKAQDVTQEKLADYLNISYQAVSKWENGVSHS